MLRCTLSDPYKIQDTIISSALDFDFLQPPEERDGENTLELFNHHLTTGIWKKEKEKGGESPTLTWH